MDVIDRETVLFIFDVVIRLAAALAIIYFVRSIYCSFRRGYVFIYGKAAKRQDDALGFWFGIFCWAAASGILGGVVYRGL